MEIALIVNKGVCVTAYRTEGAVIDYLVRTLCTWTEAMAYDTIERLQEGRLVTRFDKSNTSVN